MIVEKTAADAARQYMGRGFATIPLPLKAMAAKIKGWPNLRLTEPDLRKYFQRDSNIGLLTGEPSGGVVDVDLESPESLILAENFLPARGLVHGRLSKPRSHRFYRNNSVPKPEKFADVEGASLLELRSTGQVTMVPLSTHLCGEVLEWKRDGGPANYNEPQPLDNIDMGSILRAIYYNNTATLGVVVQAQIALTRIALSFRHEAFLSKLWGNACLRDWQLWIRAMDSSKDPLSKPEIRCRVRFLLTSGDTRIPCGPC